MSTLIVVGREPTEEEMVTFRNVVRVDAGPVEPVIHVIKANTPELEVRA